MKKLLIGFLVAVFLVGVFGQMAEAAQWGYHPKRDGRLKVYATVNCTTKGEPLFDAKVESCKTERGFVPRWCNDLLRKFYADGDSAIKKVAVPGYKLGRWTLAPLAEWVETNVPDSVVLPSIADSTGVIQPVYVAVNLIEWLADPRPLQDEYTIVDGECDDLPGYLIGTTPITFDPLAPPGENPLQTTPLTGELVRDGETIFTPETAIPTLSEWGLIIFGMVLIGFITWVFLRRRRAVASLH